MMHLLKKLKCFVRGHNYPCYTVNNYSLCFCTCCSKEIADRTLDDIEYLPVFNDEQEWL